MFDTPFKFIALNPPVFRAPLYFHEYTHKSRDTLSRAGFVLAICALVAIVFS